MKKQAHQLKLGDWIIAEGEELRVVGIQQSHQSEGALLFSFRNDARGTEHLSSRSKIETFEITNNHIAHRKATQCKLED